MGKESLWKTVIDVIKAEIIISWIRIYSKTPWFTAAALSAWWKYKESELYRQRWIHFGEVSAAKLYTYREHKFFLQKVKDDKILMKKILYSPFAVIRENNSERDDELRQHINLKWECENEQNNNTRSTG